MPGEGRPTRPKLMNREEIVGEPEMSGRKELRADQLCQKRCGCGGICLAEGMEDAGENFECTGSPLVFRAMRNLTAYHGRSQIPFGTIVGWLDSLLFQKPQHMASIVLRAHSVQQPLIVL